MYKSGLLIYIERQKTRLDLKSSVREKLYDMLMDYHRSQVKSILDSDTKLQIQLMKLDSMLDKYQRSCFEFDSALNQYDLDLI